MFHEQSPSCIAVRFITGEVLLQSDLQIYEPNRVAYLPLNEKPDILNDWKTNYLFIYLNDSSKWFRFFLLKKKYIFKKALTDQPWDRSHEDPTGWDLGTLAEKGRVGW